MPEQLPGQLIHVTGTPPWLLRPVKVSTSSELYLDYFRLPTFLNVQASSFFIHSPFPTQSVRLPLVTYPSLSSTCVTYRTLCHAIGHQVLPTQPLPREVEDFPRADKYFKLCASTHMPNLLLTKRVHVVGSIYVLRTLCGTLICPSLVLNQHFKTHYYCLKVVV